MFLHPKKTKYKKIRKGTLKKFEYKANSIKFGEIGLKATSSGILSNRQIESARRIISRKIKRKGKIWLRVFPDLPITSKPSESRMGKGKGAVSYWAVKIKSGSTLFEICGVPFYLAKEALVAAGKKLSIQTKVFD
jgi:large subunit ribosomal protein L16